MRRDAGVRDRAATRCRLESPEVCTVLARERPRFCQDGHGLGQALVDAWTRRSAYLEAELPSEIMKPVNSRNLPASTSHSTDICIVGAGVAGISIALQFAGTSRSICLIESGAYSPDQDVQSLYDLSQVGYRTREDATSRIRYFGGSSNIWAGRSMKLDPADLCERDWVPNSGWPIGYAELDRYYRPGGARPGVAELCRLRRPPGPHGAARGS